LGYVAYKMVPEMTCNVSGWMLNVAVSQLDKSFSHTFGWFGIAVMAFVTLKLS